MSERITEPRALRAAGPKQEAAAGEGATGVELSLDCRGLLCPLPVYQASRAIAQLAPGQVLRVECTDPGSLADFPALARQRGLTLVSVEVQDGAQVFRLRREADR